MQPTSEKKTLNFRVSPHFKINALSALTCQVENIYQGCEREYFEILWISEGEGIYLVNDSKFSLTANSVYYGAPGHYHQIRSEKPVKGFILSFNEEFLHKGFDVDSGLHTADILSDFLKFTIIPMQEIAGTELNALIQKMHFESESGKEMKMDILKFYLRILMIHVRRCMDKSVTESPGRNHMVRKFLTQIERDYFEKKSVSDYASMLCVTPNYLNQMVKQQTGSTAGFYIRRRIIAEAKLKASHSDLSMKEVAYSLGFDNEAHFSKFFKNYTGMNFSEYKRESQSINVVENGFTQLQRY